MPYITQKQINEWRMSDYKRGYDDGRKVAVLQEESSLKAKVTEHQLRVFHLHSASRLVKALHEHLRLAGVPEWNPRRD